MRRAHEAERGNASASRTVRPPECLMIAIRPNRKMLSGKINTVQTGSDFTSAMAASAAPANSADGIFFEHRLKRDWLIALGGAAVGLDAPPGDASLGIGLKASLGPVGHLFRVGRIPFTVWLEATIVQRLRERHRLTKPAGSCASLDTSKGAIFVLSFGTQRGMLMRASCLSSAPPSSISGSTSASPRRWGSSCLQ
jgi:hypothetical protein